VNESEALGFTGEQAEKAEATRLLFVRMGGDTFAFTAALREVVRAMQPSMEAMMEMARALSRFGRHAADPFHRLDGRPRRTGHRHRGTRAWARRWG
jgi:hypothetical protein